MPKTRKWYELTAIIIVTLCAIINTLCLILTLYNFYCYHKRKRYYIGTTFRHKLTNQTDGSTVTSDISDNNDTKYTSKEHRISNTNDKSRNYGGRTIVMQSHESHNNKKVKIKSFFKYVTTVSVVSFTLGSYTQITTQYMFYFGNTTSNLYSIIDIFPTILWWIGKVSIYILFMGRLHYSFKGSYYEYSWYWYLIICLLLFGCSVVYIIYFLGQNYGEFSNDVLFHTIVCGMSLDLLSSIIVLILFLRQLLRLTMSQLNNNSTTIQTTYINKMISGMTKYTVLAMFAIMFDMCTAGVWSYYYYYYWSNNISDKTIIKGLEYLLNIVGDIENLINIIVLTLYYSFPIPTKIYRCLCYPCYYLCYKTCACIASSNIKNEQEFLMEHE